MLRVLVLLFLSPSSGPRRAVHQRSGCRWEEHSWREGHHGVPEGPRQLSRVHPLRTSTTQLQREADAGLNVPLVSSHADWVARVVCPLLPSPEPIWGVFHFRLFAIGSQLSPEVGSSGIEMLETDVFKLHCFQTLTGPWTCHNNPLMCFIYFLFCLSKCSF